MKQEERQLLLQDLYARIPFGVKILHQGWNYEWDQELSTLERVTGIDENFIYTKVINNGEEYTSDEHTISLFEDKPYLFLLSSMTEEQLYNNPIGFSQMLTIKADRDWENITINRRSYYKLVDWFNKNHFDYRGLIEKGLALDATGLNIY